MKKADTDVTLEYVDADGVASRREVSIEAVVTDDKRTYLECWDYIRSGVRSFRLDRVRYFIDNDGEVIQPDVFLRNLDVKRVTIDAPRFSNAGIEAINGPATSETIEFELVRKKPARPKVTIWTVIFWIAIALIVALSVSIGQGEDGMIIGTISFLILAGPLFLIRAVLRWWRKWRVQR